MVHTFSLTLSKHFHSCMSDRTNQPDSRKVIEDLLRVISSHQSSSSTPIAKKPRRPPSTLNKYSLSLQRAIKTIERGDKQRGSVQDLIASIPAPYQEALYDRISHLSRVGMSSTPPSASDVTAGAKYVAKQSPESAGTTAMPEKRRAEEQATPSNPRDIKPSTTVLSSANKATSDSLASLFG